MNLNNYLKVELSDRNEFRCLGNFIINGLNLTDLDFKIDTGCSKTSIPIKRTPLDHDKILELMMTDYSNPNIKKAISFGVNDSEEKKQSDRQKFKSGRFLELNSITCIKKLEEFTIAGLNLGDMELRVSYIRTGNILIGMDILSKFDIHIAPDKTNNNKTTLIACQLNRINDDYLLELEKSFGILTLGQSALVRDSIKS